MLENKEVNIYYELLNQLHIDADAMQDIICSISKQPNSTFTFLKASSDMRIMYFRDEIGHLFPITLDKICEVRDMYVQIYNKRG